MIDRPFWLHRIEAAWKEAPIGWLHGARGFGKTALAQRLSEAWVRYVSCDLPAVEDMVHDLQPKAYPFDAGFVSFARGWDSLRRNDCSVLC
jgi:hypothetical protein